jgi:hypothetical protein
MKRDKRKNLSLPAETPAEEDKKEETSGDKK